MDISHEKLLSLLEYNPLTGIWHWKTRSCHRIRPNRVAGCVYRNRNIIRIGKKNYFASRLAWFYMTGKWSELEIDHKNTNSLDDKWENLREATSSQNKCNRPKAASNRTGFKGVVLHCSGLYHARIQFKKKVFSLGYFKTALEAHEAYVNASGKIHGEFARAA